MHPKGKENPIAGKGIPPSVDQFMHHVQLVPSEEI